MALRRKALSVFTALLMLAGAVILGYGAWLRYADDSADVVAVDVPVMVAPVAPVVPSQKPRVTKTTVPKIPEPREGTIFARLVIPRMDKSLDIKHGVRPQDIKRHPGHYPGTAMPGEVGNFALAGHRVRKIFYDVDDLRAGDLIHVDFNDKRYTYKVYKRYVVANDAWEVVAPTPGDMDAEPTQKVLTLTTCLKSGNHKREVVHAVLQE